MMRFGAPIVSPARLQLRRFAMFAQWDDQAALDPRFLKWGRPFERLIASHPGSLFSTGAQRPPHTISTFSIWRSVREMTDMVHGRGERADAHVHQVAMAEQRRRDFHHESTFMRFRPLSEHGRWQGRRLLPPGAGGRASS